MQSVTFNQQLIESGQIVIVSFDLSVVSLTSLIQSQVLVLLLANSLWHKEKFYSRTCSVRSGLSLQWFTSWDRSCMKNICVSDEEVFKTKGVKERKKEEMSGRQMRRPVDMRSRRDKLGGKEKEERDGRAMKRRWVEERIKRADRRGMKRRAEDGWWMWKGKREWEWEDDRPNLKDKRDKRTDE